MKKNWKKPEVHELDVKATEMTLFQNGSDSVISEATITIGDTTVTVPVGDIDS